VTNDAIARKRVEAALRGETGPPVTLDDLVNRETALTKQWCGLAKMAYPGADVVDRVLREADQTWGGLNEHDRFVPGSIGLELAFQAIIGWNEQCDKERQPGLKVKLAVTPGEEFWRQDKSVQRLPTDCGVFRCGVPLAEIAHPWDSQGRPYNLIHEAQDEACREVGGEGLSTAEELMFLVGRGTIEHPGRPCWPPTCFRAKNFFGSGSSLSVYWNVGGLKVISWYGRDSTFCGLGALPRRLLRA